MISFDRQLEILAPAGSREAFFAAVNSYADAVYLGLDNFNARAKAEGFDADNIAFFITYAHLFGVKVYITFNTLVRDDEIYDFIKMVEACYNSGADAFIVQDFGMGMLIKKLFPSAVLHSSTQMGIHNLYGAKFLEKCGYKRIILSRETRLEDIKEIKRNTNLEIEYFVQGALCVCFSGNCYLSSVKDGNSGNRGRCRQLCRLKYKFENNSGYYLSPKDLCLADKLAELAEAGVTSFKIEGRLKRAGYVAACVKAYRLAISGKDYCAAIADIGRCFSRGDYNKFAYLNGNDNIINASNSSETGTKIGRVKAASKFGNLYKVTIESSAPINSGDGLRILCRSQVITLGVGNVSNSGNLYTIYTTKRGLERDSEVFKTTDTEFEKNIIPPKRIIKVDAFVKAYAGERTEIALCCEGKSVSVTGECSVKADNRPIDADFVKNQIKFDSLPMELGSVTLQTDGAFITKSAFNELRRRAITALIAIFSPLPQTKRYSKEDILRAEAEYLDSLNAFNRQENYVITNEPTDIDKNIIISPKNYDYKAIEGLIGKNGNYFLNLPVFATSEDIKIIDDIIAKADALSGAPLGVVANNYYGLKYSGERKVIIGTGLNVYNNITAGLYVKSGAYDIMSSIEISFNDRLIKYIGNPPLMTLIHCPYKLHKLSDCAVCPEELSSIEYTDERGNLYRISRNKIKNCFFELRAIDKRLYNDKKINSNKSDKNKKSGSFEGTKPNRTAEDIRKL